MVDPSLSILMPAYRCQEYIGRAIESVQAQTYVNWELIVVNDGSDDDLEGVAKTFAKSDPRIRVSAIPHGGHSMALNACFIQARGDLIGRQDADDWSLPTRFETQIRELLNTEADLCSCLMQRHIQRGSRCRVVLGRNVGGSGMIPHEFCLRDAVKGPAAATLVFHRKVYDRLGGFDTTAPGHMMGSTDSDWIFRALLVDDPPYKWAHVHDELYCYRDHPKQGTKLFSRVGMTDHLDFRKKYAPTILARLGHKAGMR